MSLVTNTVQSAELVAEMTWDTWWALVLGFALSGAVEAFASEDAISDLLGGNGWREIGLGAAFGVASSSCSYSAVGTAKTLFKKGASGAASLGAFMFASTDLVIELGLVVWVLLGWQFVVGEYLGGIVAVVVLGVLFRHVVPARWFDASRDHLRATDETACPTCDVSVDPTDPEAVTAETADGTVAFCCGGCRRVFQARENDERSGGIAARLLSVEGWRSASRAAIKDWEMLWTDIALGFVVAGLVAGFVPDAWWTALFGAEATFGGVLAATAIAIGIGVLTFMCSVGNVPFALVLWQNGLPYGAVLSFIYADLLVPPLVNVYRKYYGARMAATLVASLALAAAVAGITVHYVVGALGVVPPPGSVGGTVPDAYTTVLNLVFTPIFCLQVVATYGLETVRDRSVDAVARVFATAQSGARLAGRSVELATGATAAVLADPSALSTASGRATVAVTDLETPAAKVRRAGRLVRSALVETVAAVLAAIAGVAVRLDASRRSSDEAETGRDGSGQSRDQTEGVADSGGQPSDTSDSETSP